MAVLTLQKRTAKKARTISVVLGALAAAASFFSSPAQALVLDRALNEQVVMVPAGDSQQGAELETTIYKPPGDGPFPVLLMNHGKALGNPRNQGRDRFVAISREFVKRGYAVVIPMRKGFSHSTGEYIDPGCDMTAHGQLQADDVISTLSYLRSQPWADSEHVIVAGQSYGGLTAMAFGSRSMPGVKGIINFAGGLKIHGGSCHWQQSLVNAFADYGMHTSLPSLWFYGENDQHFGPELAARLYRAYVQAGGHAKLIAYGPFKKDAHGMSGSRDGVKIWWPETEKFLKQVGMPTEQVVAIDDDIRVPEVQYAALDNVDAVPYLQGSARDQYRAFLNKPFPRAFAVSPTGAWSWAEDGDDPVAQALEDCQKNSSQSCRLYAVDDKVVWAQEQPVVAVADAPSVPMAAAPVSAQTASATGAFAGQ